MLLNFSATYFTIVLGIFICWAWALYMVWFVCLSMHSILVRGPYHKYLYEKVKIYYFIIIYIVLHLYLYIIYTYKYILHCIFLYMHIYIYCVCSIRTTLFRGITHLRNHRLPNKKPGVCCVILSFWLLVRSASENLTTTQAVLLVLSKLRVFSVENITHIGHRTNGISLFAMDIEHFVR